MANNRVQYAYEIIDRYQPVIRNIIAANKRFVRSQKKADRALKKTRDRMREVARSARRMGQSMSLRMTLPITAALGLMTKNIVDAEETFSKFGVTFSGVIDRANTVADELRMSYGLSALESKKLLSNTGDLLTGFEFTQEEALNLAEQVNKLAVDLASFTNIEGGAERASMAITKGLLGERESMKLLGIAINENDPKFKALVKHYTSVEKKSIVQAKALSVLKLAQRQSKNAIGDYARTSQSAANQMKLFTSRLQDLSLSFRNEILPFVTKAVTWLNSLVERVSKLTPLQRKWALAVALLLASLGPVVMFLGAMAFLISAMLSPIALWVIGIGAAVGALVALWMNLGRVFEWAKKNPVFMILLGPIMLFIAALKMAFKMISAFGQIIMDVFGRVMNVVKMAIDTINKIQDSKIGKLMGILGVGIVPGGGLIKAGMSAIKGAVDINLNAPKGTVKSASTQSKTKGFNLGLVMGGA